MQASKPAASAEQKRRRTDAAAASASADSPAATTAAAGAQAEDAAEELARLRAEVAEKSQLLVVVVQENQRLRTLLANYMAHDNRLMSTSQLSQGEPCECDCSCQALDLTRVSFPMDCGNKPLRQTKRCCKCLRRSRRRRCRRSQRQATLLSWTRSSTKSPSSSWSGRTRWQGRCLSKGRRDRLNLESNRCSNAVLTACTCALLTTIAVISNAQEIVGPKNIASTIRRALVRSLPNNLGGSSSNQQQTELSSVAVTRACQQARLRSLPNPWCGSASASSSCTRCDLRISLSVCGRARTARGNSRCRAATWR